LYKCFSIAYAVDMAQQATRPMARCRPIGWMIPNSCKYRPPPCVPTNLAIGIRRPRLEASRGGVFLVRPSTRVRFASDGGEASRGASHDQTTCLRKRLTRLGIRGSGEACRGAAWTSGDQNLLGRRQATLQRPNTVWCGFISSERPYECVKISQV